VRVPGYFNTWPKMVVEFADRVGQQPEPLLIHRGMPQFAMIDWYVEPAQKRLEANLHLT
jgi:hypothetical protein